jgi:U3 small nucleolar RNA-associated protein 14
VEANPWIASTRPEESDAGTRVETIVAASRRDVVDVLAAADLIRPPTDERNRFSDQVAESSANKMVEANISTLTQEELVRRAFATASDKELEDEFANEKRRVEESEDPSRKIRKEQTSSAVAAGWGSWTGQGAPAPKPTSAAASKRMRGPPALKKAERAVRSDASKPTVIISERRMKRMEDKYMVRKVPYPFTTREEYEQSMEGGLGREWNVTSGFKDMTRPEILTRAGKIIQPLPVTAKQRRRARPAAKF